MTMAGLISDDVLKKVEATTIVKNARPHTISDKAIINNAIDAFVAQTNSREDQRGFAQILFKKMDRKLLQDMDYVTDLVYRNRDNEFGPFLYTEAMHASRPQLALFNKKYEAREAGDDTVMSNVNTTLRDGHIHIGTVQNLNVTVDGREN